MVKSVRQAHARLAAYGRHAPGSRDEAIARADLLSAEAVESARAIARTAPPVPPAVLARCALILLRRAAALDASAELEQ